MRRKGIESAGGKKRIIHVFGSMDPGGAELRTLEVWRQLQNEVVFDFITVRGTKGCLAPRIRVEGGEVYPFHLKPTSIVKMWCLLRRLKPQSVHSHVALSSGLFVLIAAAARVPQRIVHFRSDGDGRGNGVTRRVRRRLLRTLIYCCATDIVGVTEASIHSNMQVSSLTKRMQRVANGFDVGDVGVPTQSVGLNILSVARANAAKNRVLALHVLNLLLLNGFAAKLTIIGGNWESDKVLQTIKKLGLESFVTLIDFVSDPRSLMLNFDCLLLTSHREGLPGVVLEALSVGLPVVSTSLPGTQEIAQHFDPFISLVDPSVEAERLVPNLAQALVAMWADDSSGRPGEIRDRFVESPYLMERVIEEYRRLYKL